MDKKHVFNCPHCGKEIVAGPAKDEEKPQQAEQAESEPTDSQEDVELPIKDVILEPEPIEEVEAEDEIEEIEPEEIDPEEIEEIAPDEIEEYVPKRPVRRGGGRPEEEEDEPSPRRPRKAPRSRREGPDAPPARGGKKRRPPRGGRPPRTAKRTSRGEPAGDNYDVVLDPVPADLEDLAIDLIMEFGEVDEREAEKILGGRFIVPVKNVPKEEAEDILAEFEAEGLPGSVKRKRPRR
ncbi:MAG: hypothetical protein U5N86_03030 [Planctomycetota bacterium]|nr:hypothetical protein [Planctomycetota bacterium]